MAKKPTTSTSAADTAGNVERVGANDPPEPEAASGTIGTTENAAHRPVIKNIISLCDIPDDTVMVEFINQQKWTKLFHVTTIGIDEVKDFYTTLRDGYFEAKPMMVHIRMFKCFLLFYKHKSHDRSSILTEDEVMNLQRLIFIVIADQMIVMLILQLAVSPKIFHPVTKVIQMLERLLMR
jgi:hypothetical protein